MVVFDHIAIGFAAVFTAHKLLYCFFGVFMGRKDDLRQIVEMAARGAIRSVVDRTFSLEEAAAAHEALESRQVFGKVVLEVK